MFFNCPTFTVCVIAALNLIAIAINEACGCITAITSRRPLVYPFLKLVFTKTPRFLVSHNVNTGEAVDKSFKRGIDKIVLIEPLKVFI